MTALSQELVERNKSRNISPITGQMIDVLWDRIWALFREVPGFLLLYDEAWTYNSVKTGHWQVWAYSDSEIRGMVLTRINEFPKCNVLEVMGISGIAGVEFMDDLDALFESLARQQACAYITMTVRPGFEKLIIQRFQGQKIGSVVSRPVGLLRRKS